jgi:hypothetical protein
MMMKYLRWYDVIMERARTRTLDGYSERHHILPRALGGSDDPDNLVVLTYREHFLAHWLLTKFTTGNDQRKMLHALWSMIRRSDLRIHLIAKWQYPIARRAAAGPKTPEHVAKVAASLTGKRRSIEAKARMSAAQAKSPEQRAKLSKAGMGHKRSQASIDRQKATLATKDRSKPPAQRAKMREAALRRYQDPAERERTAAVVKEALKDVDRAGPNNSHFGKAHSRESKALISRRVAERGGHGGTKNPNYRHGRDVQT